MCRVRRDESCRRRATIRQLRIGEATRPGHTAAAVLAATADIAATASRLTDDPMPDRTVVAAIQRRPRIAQVPSEAITAAPDLMEAPVITAVRADTRAAARMAGTDAKLGNLSTPPEWAAFFFSFRMSIASHAVET